jgi:hypothetical protein
MYQKQSLQSPFWEFFNVFLNAKIQQNQKKKTLK